jgi:hypothetical protein
MQHAQQAASRFQLLPCALGLRINASHYSESGAQLLFIPMDALSYAIQSIIACSQGVLQVLPVQLIVCGKVAQVPMKTRPKGSRHIVPAAFTELFFHLCQCTRYAQRADRM